MDPAAGLTAICHLGIICQQQWCPGHGILSVLRRHQAHLQEQRLHGGMLCRTITGSICRAACLSSCQTGVRWECRVHHPSAPSAGPVCQNPTCLPGLLSDGKLSIESEAANWLGPSVTPRLTLPKTRSSSRFTPMDSRHLDMGVGQGFVNASIGRGSQMGDGRSLDRGTVCIIIIFLSLDFVPLYS